MTATFSTTQNAVLTYRKPRVLLDFGDPAVDGAEPQGRVLSQQLLDDVLARR